MSAQLETEKREYQTQLDLVITSLQDDPDNSELLSLEGELEQMVKLIDDSLADLNVKNPPAAPSPPAPGKTASRPPPPPDPASSSAAPTTANADDKWSRENHPAFRKASAAAAATAAAVEERKREKEREADRAQREQQQQREREAAAEREAEALALQHVYRVNDGVMARWLSGDKGFYPARITAVTGSSTAPVYTVRFRSYDTVETLRARDIRPAAVKRKAAAGEGDAVGGGAGASPLLASPLGTPLGGTSGVVGGGGAGLLATDTSTNNGIVLSAAANMYPEEQIKAQQAAREASGAGGVGGGADKPKPKFKKIKANKELEAGKNKWQEFNSKSRFGKSSAAAAGGKKDSMFRTPDGIHGRVGFTGSGQAMRKDPTRTRHIYQQGEEQD